MDYFFWGGVGTFIYISSRPTWTGAAYFIKMGGSEAFVEGG